ncbi:MAG: GNAT family N-acetyltransferase [Solirubrobacteraceae bacterium]
MGETPHGERERCRDCAAAALDNARYVNQREPRALRMRQTAAMPLLLRPTTEADLDAVTAIETAPDAACWLTVWPRERHLRAVEDSDIDHLVAVAGPEVCAFVLLLGLDSPHHTVELRRIAVAPARRGGGIGRETLDLALQRAFGHHRAQRVWLDVLPANTVARGLYARAGFIEEGVMREAYRHPDGGFSPLLLMSTLRGEWSGAANDTP